MDKKIEKRILLIVAIILTISTIFIVISNIYNIPNLIQNNKELNYDLKIHISSYNQEDITRYKNYIVKNNLAILEDIFSSVFFLVIDFTIWLKYVFLAKQLKTAIEIK